MTCSIDFSAESGHYTNMRQFTACLFFLFSIRQADSPSLKCQEVGHLNLPDGYPSVYYRLTPENFSQAKKYALSLVSLDGKKTLLEEYSPQKNPLCESVQMLAYFRPGEPLRFILESDDKIEKAAVSAVPLPIAIAGADGCKVSVEMASPDGKIFACKGEGFKAGEKVRVCSVSLGNTIDEVLTAGVDGAISMTLKPAVKKKKGGKCALEVRRQEETLLLKFGWGREALLKPTAPIAEIPSEASHKQSLEKILESIQMR